MAAPTGTVAASALKLSAGGALIGFGTSGSINVTQGLNSGPHDQDANWASASYAGKSASVEFGALYDEDGARLSARDLSVEVGDVVCVSSLGIDIAVTMDESMNSCVGAWRTVFPTTRTITLRIETDYYDPLGSGNTGTQNLWAEVFATDPDDVTVEIAFAGFSLSLTAKVTSGVVNKQAGSRLKATFTLVSEGAVTAPTTGDLGTGLENLLTAVFAAGQSSAIAVKATTAVTGATEYVGSGYVERLAINVPVLGEVTTSGTIAINGALAPQATPAP